MFADGVACSAGVDEVKVDLSFELVAPEAEDGGVLDGGAGCSFDHVVKKENGMPYLLAMIEVRYRNRIVINKQRTIGGIKPARRPVRILSSSPLFGGGNTRNGPAVDVEFGNNPVWIGTGRPTQKVRVHWDYLIKLSHTFRVNGGSID